MHRAYFDFHGLRLSYLEAGEKHNRKLFIAHANGYAAGCYDYLIKALSADFHVCALDFAGHGESQATLAFDSWDFFRDQITAFFAYKNWKHCIAIGHSLGGGSLLRAAIENSEQFEKIIAFDPVMLSFPAVIYVKLFGNPMARVALGRRADFKNKEQALKIFSRHPANRNWEKDSVRAYVEYCIRETRDGDAELCCDPAMESRIFSQAGWRHLLQLGRIRCEVQLILPGHSNVCPPRIATRVTAKHPRSAIERVAEAGHLLPFENRGLTLSLVKKHL